MPLDPARNIIGILQETVAIIVARAVYNNTVVLVIVMVISR